MGNDDERLKKQADIRDEQALVREGQAEVREGQAEVRENQAGVRDDQAVIREDQAFSREQIADTRDTLSAKNHKIIHRLMKILLWVSIVLFVITIVSLFRSFQLQSAVKALDNHTTDLSNQTNAAKDAAIEARDTLQAALDEFEERRNSEEASSPTAIRNALLSIARIEVHLCGGPCDENAQP